MYCKHENKLRENPQTHWNFFLASAAPLSWVCISHSGHHFHKEAYTSDTHSHWWLGICWPRLWETLAYFHWSSLVNCYSSSGIHSLSCLGWLYWCRFLHYRSHSTVSQTTHSEVSLWSLPGMAPITNSRSLETTWTALTAVAFWWLIQPLSNSLLSSAPWYLRHCQK